MFFCENVFFDELKDYPVHKESTFSSDFSYISAIISPIAKKWFYPASKSIMFFSDRTTSLTCRGLYEFEKARETRWFSELM
jgi:hypothetical protein